MPTAPQRCLFIFGVEFVYDIGALGVPGTADTIALVATVAFNLNVCEAIERIGGFMGKTSRNAMKWTRLAAKLGLLATDPAIRKVIADRVTETVRDFRETVATKYGDASQAAKGSFEAASDRVQAVTAVFEKPSSPWPPRVGRMVLGFGVGAGLAFLFAPATGSDTRKLIRDTAARAKGRGADFASRVELDQPLPSIPFTRAEG